MQFTGMLFTNKLFLQSAHHYGELVRYVDGTYTYFVMYCDEEFGAPCEADGSGESLAHFALDYPDLFELACASNELPVEEINEAKNFVEKEDFFNNKYDGTLPSETLDESCWEKIHQYLEEADVWDSLESYEDADELCSSILNERIDRMLKELNVPDELPF